MDERKLTQAKAAVLFGVTHPPVSDLNRGRLDLFSRDALVDVTDHYRRIAAQQTNNNRYTKGST